MYLFTASVDNVNGHSSIIAQKHYLYRDRERDAAHSLQVASIMEGKISGGNGEGGEGERFIRVATPRHLRGEVVVSDRRVATPCRLPGEGVTPSETREMSPPVLQDGSGHALSFSVRGCPQSSYPSWHEHSGCPLPIKGRAWRALSWGSSHSSPPNTGNKKPRSRFPWDQAEIDFIAEKVNAITASNDQRAILTFCSLTR